LFAADSEGTISFHLLLVTIQVTDCFFFTCRTKVGGALNLQGGSATIGRCRAMNCSADIAQFLDLISPPNVQSILYQTTIIACSPREQRGQMSCRMRDETSLLISFMNATDCNTSSGGTFVFDELTWFTCQGLISLRCSTPGNGFGQYSQNGIITCSNFYNFTGWGSFVTIPFFGTIWVGSPGVAVGVDHGGRLTLKGCRFAGNDQDISPGTDGFVTVVDCYFTKALATAGFSTAGVIITSDFDPVEINVDAGMIVCAFPLIDVETGPTICLPNPSPTLTPERTKAPSPKQTLTLSPKQSPSPSAEQTPSISPRIPSSPFTGTIELIRSTPLTISNRIVETSLIDPSRQFISPPFTMTSLVGGSVGIVGSNDHKMSLEFPESVKFLPISELIDGTSRFYDSGLGTSARISDSDEFSVTVDLKKSEDFISSVTNKESFEFAATVIDLDHTILPVSAAVIDTLVIEKSSHPSGYLNPAV
jgi:hypothetical protein